MNIPYVKQYSPTGILLNPIKGSYINEFANRRQRRSKLGRFIGNGKNYPLVVTSQSKHVKVVQLVADKKTGELKKILHYLQN